MLCWKNAGCQNEDSESQKQTLSVFFSKLKILPVTKKQIKQAFSSACYEKSASVIHDRKRIQGLRLMDDDFMTIVFSGDNKLTEFLLRILLDRTDLTVKQSLTQKEKHNIFGRSVRLDVLAVDTEGKQYNIEIQRADKGASGR